MFAPTSGTRPLLLAAAMLATFTFSAQAQDKAEEKIDLKKGAWSELAQYIGTYEYDAVLDNKHVKTQLDKLLKGQKIDLQSLLEVSAPIGFEKDCLVLKGNPEHKGDEMRAFLEACISTEDVRLAVYKEGKITIYAASSNYTYLNDGMRTWIYFQSKQPEMFTQPSNVQFIVP